MAGSGARLYTATHLVLLNSLVRSLDCPRHAEAARRRVRALCSGILTEAETLHHQLEDSANTPHCLTDLWLEQSKDSSETFPPLSTLVGFCLGLGSDQRFLRADWLETLLSLTTRQQHCIIR